MKGEDLLRAFGETAPEYLEDMELLRREKTLAGIKLRKGWRKMRGISFGLAAAAAVTAVLFGTRFHEKDPSSLPPETSAEVQADPAEEESTETLTDPAEEESTEALTDPADETLTEAADEPSAENTEAADTPARAILAETSGNDLVTLDFSGNVLATLRGASLAYPLSFTSLEAVIVEEGVPIPVRTGSEINGLYDPFSGEWVIEPAEQPLYRLSPSLVTNSQAYLANGILMDNRGQQIPGSGTAVFSRVGDYVSNGVQLFDLKGQEICTFPGQMNALYEDVPLPDGTVKTCAVISREDGGTSLYTLDGQEVFREMSGLTCTSLAGGLISWRDANENAVITDLSLQPILTEAEFYARNPDYVKPIDAGNGISLLAVSEDGERLLIVISYGHDYCICDRDFRILQGNVQLNTTLGHSYYADEDWLVQAAQTGNKDYWYTKQEDGQLWAVCFITGETICLGDYTPIVSEIPVQTGLFDLFSRDAQAILLYKIGDEASGSSYMMRLADGTVISLPRYTVMGQLDVFASGIIRVSGRVQDIDENGNLSSSLKLTEYYTPEGELLASDTCPSGLHSMIPDEDNLLLVTPEIECREINGEIIVK